MKINENGLRRQYRQGDVLLHPVDRLPESTTPIAAEGGHYVLAHGEATGHAHAVAADHRVHFYQAADGRRYLEVLEPTDFRHEEHDVPVLEVGTYEVRGQVESWLDEVRPVVD